MKRTQTRPGFSKALRTPRAEMLSLSHIALLLEAAVKTSARAVTPSEGLSHRGAACVMLTERDVVRTAYNLQF